MAKLIDNVVDNGLLAGDAEGVVYGETIFRGQQYVIQDVGETGSGYFSFGTSMATVPTSPTTGTGVFINYSGVYGNAAGVKQFYLDAATGAAFAGAGAVTLDVNGITILGGAGAPNRITWVDGTAQTIGRVDAIELVAGTQTYTEVYSNPNRTFAVGKALLLAASSGGAGYDTAIFINSEVGHTYAAIAGVPSTFGLAIRAGGGGFEPSALLHLKSAAPDLLFDDATAAAKQGYIKNDADHWILYEYNGGTPTSIIDVDLSTTGVTFAGSVIYSGDLTVNGGDLTLASTAPTITLSDTTASAKDGFIKVDGNKLYIQELAGSDGSLGVFDLTNIRFGIGGSPTQTFEVFTTSNNAGMQLTFTGASASNAGPGINMIVNDGSAMASADRLGIVIFGGYDGTANRIGAQITASTTEAWDSTHRGSKVQIATIPSGTTGLVNALTIEQDQSITVAGGINAVTMNGNLTMADAKNIVINTSTGTKFGTGTTQKMGWWNATPVGQGSAFTQTYATADKTLNADGVTDPAAYAAGANGYSTAAMAQAVHAAVIALHADLLDAKQFMNSIVDQLQTYGLFA